MQNLEKAVQNAVHRYIDSATIVRPMMNIFPKLDIYIFI